MTARVLQWAESWPAFVIMSLWLLGWVVTQLAPGDPPRPEQRPGTGAAHAAKGAVVHTID